MLLYYANALRARQVLGVQRWTAAAPPPVPPIVYADGTSMCRYCQHRKRCLLRPGQLLISRQPAHLWMTAQRPTAQSLMAVPRGIQQLTKTTSGELPGMPVLASQSGEATPFARCRMELQRAGQGHLLLRVLVVAQPVSITHKHLYESKKLRRQHHLRQPNFAERVADLQVLVASHMW